MSGSAQPGGGAPGRSADNGLRADEDEDGDLDDEVDASRLERFMRDRRRARSLPAYPGALLDAGTGSSREKRVKFADSLGLNLASVKHFSSLEEPQIPSKVLSRHQSFPPQQQDLSELCHSFQSNLGAGRRVAGLPDPRETERRVRELRVCLEKVSVTQVEVRGHIRVSSGCTDKEVGVRYTFNDWLSHVDARALRVAADPPDSAGERFSFTVHTPPCADPSAALHFAVYLRSAEGEFWDNNQGLNYTVRHRCVPGAAFHAT